ncbi:hypothetical protein ACWF94_03590 [Streptomyces sp. NPDC055078]
MTAPTAPVAGMSSLPATAGGRYGWHALAARLGVDPTTAARARTALGIPRARGGTRPATAEAVFHARTRRVRGGHLAWTGHRNAHGVPLIRIAGICRSAYRVAFRLRHGRDPVGKVRPGCGRPGCVAPDHLEDRPMRERTKALYAAIFGGPP